MIAVDIWMRSTAGSFDPMQVPPSLHVGTKVTSRCNAGRGTWIRPALDSRARDAGTGYMLTPGCPGSWMKGIEMGCVIQSLA
nr:hypothetical protein CFP56_08138 [Quercus suber]